MAVKVRAISLYPAEAVTTGYAISKVIKVILDLMALSSSPRIIEFIHVDLFVEADATTSQEQGCAAAC